MRAECFKAMAGVSFALLLAIMAGGIVCAQAYPRDVQRENSKRAAVPAFRFYTAQEMRSPRGNDVSRINRITRYRTGQERAPRGYGAMVPEGANAQSMQRQTPDPMSRDDSIRDDITRYNAERRAARSFPRGDETPARPLSAPTLFFPQN